MLPKLTFAQKVSLIFIFIFSTKSLLALPTIIDSLPGSFLIDAGTKIISIQDIVVGSTVKIMREDGSIGTAQISKIITETDALNYNQKLWSFEANFYPNQGLVLAAQALLKIPKTEMKQEAFSPGFLIGDDGVCVLMWRLSDWNYTGKRRPIKHINRFNDWFFGSSSSSNSSKSDQSWPADNLVDTTTQARPTDNSQPAKQQQPAEPTISFEAIKSLTEKINPFDQNMTARVPQNQSVFTFVENKSFGNNSEYDSKNQSCDNYQTSDFADLVRKNPDIFPSAFADQNISEKINNFGKIEKELGSLFSQSNQTNSFNYQSEMRMSSDGRAWISASIIDELGRVHSTGWGAFSEQKQADESTNVSNPEIKLPVEMIDEIKKTWNDGSEGIDVLEEDDESKQKYNYPYCKERIVSGDATETTLKIHSKTILERSLIKLMSGFLLDSNLFNLKKKNIKKCQTLFQKAGFPFGAFLIQPRDWTFCKIALGIDDQSMPITEYEVYQDCKNIYNTLRYKAGTLLSKKDLDDLNNCIEILPPCPTAQEFVDYVKDALKSVSIISLSGPTYNYGLFGQNLFKSSLESALEARHKIFCENYRQMGSVIRACLLQDFFKEITQKQSVSYLLEKLIEKVDDRTIVYSLYEYNYDVIDEYLDNNFIQNYCSVHKTFPTKAHKRDCLRKCSHNDAALKTFISDYIEVFKRDNWVEYTKAIQDIREIIKQNKPVEESWLEIALRFNQALPDKYDRAKPRTSLRFKKIVTIAPKPTTKEKKCQTETTDQKTKDEASAGQKADLKAPEKTDWESCFNGCFKLIYAGRLAINVATDKDFLVSFSSLIATQNPYFFIPLVGSVLKVIGKTVKDDVEFVKETQIFKTLDGIKDICELKDFVKNQTSLADKTSEDVLEKMEEMQATLTKQINEKINSDPKTKAQFESSIAKFKVALKSIDSKSKITNEQLEELTKSFSTFSDNIVPDLFKTIEASSKYLKEMHVDLKTGQTEIKETVKTEATEIKEIVATEANEIKADISKLGEGIEKLGDIVQIREKLAISENENLKLLEKSKKYKNMTKEQASIILEKDKGLAQKDEVITQKDEVIAAKDKGLIQKDEVINQKDEVITQKDEVINQKDEDIKKEKAEKEKFKNYLKNIGIDPDKI